MYSALTGVLAGFAFAGILLIATERISTPKAGSQEKSPPQDRRQASLVLLLSAFLGLSISSLTYAIIAGETSSNELAAVQHVLAGSGFAVSALALLAAVHVLIQDLFPSVSSWTRVTIGMGAPAVSTIYVGEGAIQAQNATGGIGLTILVLIILASVFWHVLAIIWAFTKKESNITWRQSQFFASLSVAIAFVASVGVATLQSIDIDSTPTQFAWISFATILITMGSFTVVFGVKLKQVKLVGH
ncbi:hypothetical protein [Kocuria sp. CH-021]|uniref:hypothetical protein n=1 Tax=Kocuria sp. CH-021 TaxID=3406735 RepID=UPI003C70913E